MRPPHVAPARRAHLMRAAAAAALLVGYTDLVMGGKTIGPLLLGIGYVVLVPWVILTWR